MLTKSIFKFLADLEKNNNRDWFKEHKPRYQEVHAEFKAFANVVLDKMSHIDEIERLRVHRIYRDVRFSKDKTPYSDHFSGGMSRATKLLRGGYYFHITPGASFVGGGFWGPNPADLKLIRTDIAADPKPLRKILASKSFVQTFDTLLGDQVKTAPRGYTVDHPAIELLRYKQFYVRHPFTDTEVLSKDFPDKIVKVYSKLRPFFDYMSEVLTTDENGEPLF